MNLNIINLLQKIKIKKREEKKDLKNKKTIKKKNWKDNNFSLAFKGFFLNNNNNMKNSINYKLSNLKENNNCDNI